VKFLPSWKNAALALVSAGLLTLAFPNFEYWFLAWFALVPLMWAIEREKASTFKSFLLGWLFGAAFFFGTCWWLAYAPIHYASIPWPLAYILIFIPCVISGIFPGIFAAVLAVLLRRFGSWAFLAAPFVWVFTEFARYWITGNNWNAIAYSQAFVPEWTILLHAFKFDPAGVGGIYLVGLFPVLASSLMVYFVAKRRIAAPAIVCILLLVLICIGLYQNLIYYSRRPPTIAAHVVALQPNVPMSGLDYHKWRQLRQHQIDLAEAELRKLSDKRKSENEELKTTDEPPTLVILPESPMNFMYNDDREFQQFVRDFTTRNNVSLLFNSGEPDPTNGKYFNSAVMVNEQGNEVAQYDKIYLLPFGEAVPVPLESLVPAFVGNFSYGREYDLLPLGDAKAGVMICFESHFGQLSREYVLGGADAIIEMTNDGYLGPTPVLRQHLANAVFRAVETNRPVIRVTNVGITAYIDERGKVHDPLPPYSAGTRVWTVSKSDGSQTFYVKYGDWFAWLCTVVTIALIGFTLRRRPEAATADSFGRK
jgi:apolipoprotein N-acyltransferase